MKLSLTPVATAALLMLAGAAQAQTATPTQTIEVTGIRASIEASISQKRKTDSVVEVITAEDISKMPDKNVADSLQRVPGVTISSASASEGGFDENDRVSLRGTNPSLTQTMINGHMVGSGDWFVLNQVGTVGRSVSYSLLPSDVVGRVVVRKSAQADLVEGGVAGTVDIITRKPLEFRKALTLGENSPVMTDEFNDWTLTLLAASVRYQRRSDEAAAMVAPLCKRTDLDARTAQSLKLLKLCS